MLRKFFWGLLYPVLFCVTTSFKHGHKSVPAVKQNKLRTIIVDAGHGGPDEGAIGEYSTEADIALAIALKIGKKLEDSLPDCKIVYTRTTRDLPGGLTNPHEANRLRAKIANENHGDLFISIHVNDTNPPHKKEIVGYKEETYYTGKGKKRKKHTRTVPIIKYIKLPGTVNGTQTYVWAVAKNDQKKEFIAENEEEMFGEKVDSSFLDADSPDWKILASLRTQKYFNKSLLIAGYVQDEVVAIGRKSWGVLQRDWAGIWVLQATAMPSILVETGFMCTPAEEAYLNSQKGQEELSDCVYNAVLRYKQLPAVLHNAGALPGNTTHALLCKPARFARPYGILHGSKPLCPPGFTHVYIVF
jgi:N-acetylmuramoyl-L-alanine amidase